MMETNKLLGYRLFLLDPLRRLFPISLFLESSLNFSCCRCFGHFWSCDCNFQGGGSSSIMTDKLSFANQALLGNLMTMRCYVEKLGKPGSRQASHWNKINTGASTTFGSIQVSSGSTNLSPISQSKITGGMTTD